MQNAFVQVACILAFCRCDAPEQKQNLPCGVLKKEKQSAEDKQKELSEKIKQQQEKLEALQVSHPQLCLCLQLNVLSKSQEGVFSLENQHYQICSRRQEATTWGQHETNRDFFSGMDGFRAQNSLKIRQNCIFSSVCFLTRDPGLLHLTNKQILKILFSSQIRELHPCPWRTDFK